MTFRRKSVIYAVLPVVSILALWLGFFPSVMMSKSATVQNKTESNKESGMTLNKLTPEEERVIIYKGTEAPFTGKYYKTTAAGTYVCKQCGAPLFRSSDKFDAGCGWPSFDDEIPGAIKRTLDADGERMEITCARCGAHIGHVFVGEHLTSKNTRYCANSISLNFIPASAEVKTETAYFAGGCFWGTEYMLQNEKGVISAKVGYMGGHIPNPTYEQVCSDTTGYAETVELIFDPAQTSYETLARRFFEIHDPTQLDRQGPDVGDQYRSEIFYASEAQKQTAEKLISILKDKGYKVVTKLAPAGKFWDAEKYHQDYYEHTGKQPYCHIYQKRF
ncbi:Peptide methionine sulfoxide reductase MsrB/MsrA (Includes: Peptide methionine sulfoxide reductase MsrB; Peptide methionine sulfoxide reductase MsrA) [Candidatus Zixiibacteriota bacterium]|nr:Peptide methionine sulfoxide reductase MsrB/MsrA (Includes: Peptide methionine sulfoxide reductase MsrB; Peptide methionine sulfoxide reductase MsrA) [candidate division Zixibacteria bacterium]